MEYNCDYFIKKFENIPEKMWCTGEFFKDGKYCAAGHCGQNYLKQTAESEAINNLFFSIFHDWNISLINDGKDFRYKQPAPKQRILAALYDIKKLQSQQEPERSVANTLNHGAEPLQPKTDFIEIEFKEIKELNPVQSSN